MRRLPIHTAHTFHDVCHFLHLDSNYQGLGNSQKAEVAWLEEQGYAYEEREVGAFTYASRGRAFTSHQRALSPTMALVKSAVANPLVAQV